MSLLDIRLSHSLNITFGNETTHSMQTTVAQQTAFSAATSGAGMNEWQLAFAASFIALLLLWAGWVTYTQWKAWCVSEIGIYTLFGRVVRVGLVVTVMGYFVR